VELNPDLIAARRIVRVRNVQREVVLDAVRRTVAQPYLAALLRRVGSSLLQSPIGLVESNAGVDDVVDVVAASAGLVAAQNLANAASMSAAAGAPRTTAPKTMAPASAAKNSRPRLRALMIDTTSAWSGL